MQAIIFRTPPRWVDILEGLVKLEQEINGLVENGL
jgi:hypothetical protein